MRRGEDLAGIARWLIAAEDYEHALELLKRAIDVGLPDPLLFRALWDTALLEKKLRRPAAALHIFTELATCRNEYRICALEEIAKHYEHEERNYAMALDFTNQALEFQRSSALTNRQARLKRRLAKQQSRLLVKFPVILCRRVTSTLCDGWNSNQIGVRCFWLWESG